MTSLDGVIQAPGGPDEDRSGGFEYGGWSAPFGDEVSQKIMQKIMQPHDLLLGRKTFQIWENYWPQHSEYWPSINEVTKYVLSATVNKTNWHNTIFLKNLADIQQLKNSEGPDVQVWGSSELIQLLLKNDLADELRLIIHPITLGKGKRLFTNDTTPAAFKMVESTATPCGLIFGNYKRDGEIKTGDASVEEQ